jgi:hypothetical protein
MNPGTLEAKALAVCLILSTGESVTVRLPAGETVASVRQKLVLLGPDRPTSRTVQHPALLEINKRLVGDPTLTVEGLFLDFEINGWKCRMSLTAHRKEEA